MKLSRPRLFVYLGLLSALTLTIKIVAMDVLMVDTKEAVLTLRMVAEAVLLVLDQDMMLSVSMLLLLIPLIKHVIIRRGHFFHSWMSLAILQDHSTNTEELQ